MEDIFLAFAFFQNPDGAIITSMFGTDHIAHNCATASLLLPPAFVEDIRNVLRGED